MCGVFLTIGLISNCQCFLVELVWIIFTPKLCIILASPTMDTLAISNEREEIALLVASLAERPDGGELWGEIAREERRGEETIKDQMSSGQSAVCSLTQKCNLQQRENVWFLLSSQCFQSSCLSLSLSLSSSRKSSPVHDWGGKNWPGLNGSGFYFVFLTGDNFPCRRKRNTADSGYGSEQPLDRRWSQEFSQEVRSHPVLYAWSVA